MVTDREVRSLMEFRRKLGSLLAAADKAGMDEKTARKYVKLGKLPSEIRKPHTWRTRTDPFEGVWSEVREFLEINPGLEAKTLFEYLQRRYPKRYQDGQVRTLQRRVSEWRSTKGPGLEVMFPQRHVPGRLGQSDFTRMKKLGVTVGGEPFDHMIYHFVLTYSNWESGTICFSESFESLSEGLQRALWELGGVPEAHQSDSLTAAVQKLGSEEEFTQRYRALLSHYGLQGKRSQPRCPNENGDVEQRHHRFKRAVDQALMLRGSRDFDSRESYEAFLRKLFDQLNAGRTERLQEEVVRLRRLPLRRFDACHRETVSVRQSSTINVMENIYSVHSRLIGRKLSAYVYADHIEVWNGRSRVEWLPRLRGKRKHKINYRHIIDWLVRKPGAFERYLYRDALFPSSRFRMAYDLLEALHPGRGHKEYLKILELAAKESETRVEAALHQLMSRDGELLSFDAVERIVQSAVSPRPIQEVHVEKVQLTDYDVLLLAEKGNG